MANWKKEQMDNWQSLESELWIPSEAELQAEKKRIDRRVMFRQSILSTVFVLLIVAATAIIIATQFLAALQATGNSMEPTLYASDILVASKYSKMDTSDLVCFWFNNRVLVKRVIANAGDYVVIDEDGTVYVNDTLIDEPYVSGKSIGECDIEFPYQVPDGKLFVLGDHRDVSIDSRSSTIGCVDKEQIIGKVIFRLWPAQRLGNVT